MRRVALVLAIVLAPFLLCGGCLTAAVWFLEQPPSLGMFEPSPAGTEIVDTRTYDEALKGRPGWHVREVDFRSTDGASDDELMRRLREYGVYSKRQIYVGVDGDLTITLVEPGLGRVKYARTT